MKGSIQTLLGFLFFSEIISYTDGVLCYSCVGPNQGQCLDEPWNVTGQNPQNCSGACMTDRRDAIATVPAVFMSIRRGCNDTLVSEECSVSGIERRCYRSCNTDYCNTWDGLPNITETTTILKTTTTIPDTTVKTSTVPPNTLMCYSCSMSGTPGEPQTCLHNPDQVTTANKVPCEASRRCFTKRVNDIYPGSANRGKVKSFQRGCEVSVGQAGCSRDTYTETCVTYCRANLCNSGNGIPPTRPAGMAISNMKSHMQITTVSLLLALTHLF